MAELRDELQQLQVYGDLLQQWSTLATPSYVDAGAEQQPKDLAGAMADAFCARIEICIDELTSYHSSRADNVREVPLLSSVFPIAIVIYHTVSCSVAQ